MRTKFIFQAQDSVQSRTQILTRVSPFQSRQVFVVSIASAAVLVLALAAAFVGASKAHALTYAANGSASANVGVAVGAKTTVKASVPVVLVSTTTTTSTTTTRTINVDLGSGQSAVTTSAVVELSADDTLSAYAKTMPEVDSSVSSVDTSSSNKVIVKYKRPAKLFGFIDMNLTEKATVEANKGAKPTAKVSQSWWSFLASTDANTSQFSTVLQSRVNASANASVNGTFTSTEKAQFLADIRASAQAAYGN